MSFSYTCSHKAISISSFRIVSLAQMEPYLQKMMSEEVFENQAQAFIKSHKSEISTCPVQTCGQAPLAQMLAGPNGQTCIKDRVNLQYVCITETK